jgi:hypothetical protein
MRLGSRHFARREAPLKSVAVPAGEERAREDSTALAYRFQRVKTEGAERLLRGNHLLQTATRTASTTATLETPTRVSGLVRRAGGDGPGLLVRLTDQTLSCTAKAHVPKPERHAACLHVSRAMQAA